MIDTEKFNKLKTTYGLAIRANMEDRYRKGELIELPPTGDLIVLGDLHGNRDNFNKVIAAAGLGSNPDRHLIVQEPTHTYETAKDESFLLVAEIAELKSLFPHQVHLILGNHELSEFTGKELLKGGICYNILFREGMKQEYGPHFEEIRELMYAFMQTMPLACKTPNQIFVSHSTPELKYIPHYSLEFFRQGTGNPKKDKVLIEKLVWGRDLSQQAADAFAAQVQSQVLIVGHTACKRGYQIPNEKHIILDSKGIFATWLHFRLDRPYTHADLKRKIQYINKKTVKTMLERYRQMKENQQESQQQGK